MSLIRLLIFSGLLLNVQVACCQQRLGYSFNDSIVYYPPDTSCIIIETHPLVCMLCLKELSVFLEADSLRQPLFVMIRGYEGNKYERRAEVRRYRGLFPYATAIIFENKQAKRPSRHKPNQYPHIILSGKKEKKTLSYTTLFLPELNTVLLYRLIKDMNN